MNKENLSLEIISKVNEIKPLSATVSKMVERISNENIKIAEISELIKTDQALSAKVLKISNSAYYKGMREIKTIDDAIIRLGLNTLRNMIFAAAIGPMMEKPLVGYELEGRALWENAQLSAIVCQMIARKAAFADIDLAYTAGLLKDIGKTILDEYVHEEYEKIRELVNTGEHTFLDAEKQILGFDHSYIGAQIAKKWNFPEEICEVIEKHNTPKEAKLNPKLTMICHISDSIILMLGINMGVDGMLYQFDDNALKILGITEIDIEEIMSVAVDFLGKENNFF